MHADRPRLPVVLAAVRRPVVLGLLVLIPLSVVYGEDVGPATGPAAGACQDGTCPVGSDRLVFYDSPSGAGGLPVEVRYPASVDGSGAVAEGVFPLIVFGHGYRQSYADYADIWEALVPHGYIIAFPDKLSSSASMDLDAYARDLLFVAVTMHAVASDGTSRYFKRIADGTAFVGHSTGGGAAIVAASQIAAAPAVSSSVLILDADEDCLTPPRTHSQAIYPNLSHAFQIYRVTVLQGDHCRFSDPRGPGQAICVGDERAACTAALAVLLRQRPTLGSAPQNGVTAPYLVSWVGHHLYGNTDLPVGALPAHLHDLGLEHGAWYAITARVRRVCSGMS